MFKISKGIKEFILWSLIKKEVSVNTETTSTSSWKFILILGLDFYYIIDTIVGNVDWGTF